MRVDEWRNERTIRGMDIADLTPAALTRLEEKLVRDLETVRRVKALLLEMAGTAGEPVGAEVPVAPEVPAEPAVVKDTETVVMETIRGLGKPFRFRDVMAALPWPLSRSQLRTILQKMIRAGEVQVLETSAGQTGSLYACGSAPLPGGV